MTGLKLIFGGPAGTSFDLVNEVTDFACTVQNALVNIGTRAGSDALYPTRGTDLLKAGLRGTLVDVNAANHASNFAAIDTLSFVQQTEYTDTVEILVGVVIQPSLFSNVQLQVDAQFTSNVTTYGTLTSIQ